VGFKTDTTGLELGSFEGVGEGEVDVDYGAPSDEDPLQVAILLDLGFI
jgi:hypothetical protein